MVPPPSPSASDALVTRFITIWRTCAASASILGRSGASEYWTFAAFGKEISVRPFLGLRKLGLFANYYKNNGAYNSQDTAYFLRASYGGTKETGDWEARYTYYTMEAESLLYAFVQSDATIGTNSKSHRIDFTYATTNFPDVPVTLDEAVSSSTN